MPSPTAYSRALDRYLGSEGALKQNELAEKVGCRQAAISRYAKGHRFPDGVTARRIDDATGGAVPMDTWREVAAERAGLAA